MLRLKVLVSASALFCILAALPLYAVRRPDVPNSQNGENVGATFAEALLCPNSTATPFFAQLDGTVGPVKGPAPECDPSDANKPNPPFSPATYPNLQVTLSGSGFKVTITPALWEDGTASNVAATKSTVFQVQFSGQDGMTLQSLLIGSKLNGPTYVPCGSDGAGIAFCTTNVMAYGETLPGFFDTVALEPTGIDLADTTTTRWDFNQFTAGDSPVALMVAGFPSEFSNIDKYPNPNGLKAASFVAANFLAVVNQGPDAPLLFAGGLFDGGLTLKTAPAAPNDLFSKAVIIKKVPFKSFVDTSATNPTEVLNGSGPPAAGGMNNPQGDPTPQDPAVPNAGSPCSVPWSANPSVFRSVWYTFTPATSNNYAISTAGSRYDTGVYVFTGTPQSTVPPLPPLSPTPVACNDDFPHGDAVAGESSYVNFQATAGTTYYIMVSEVPPPVGTDTATGTIPLAAPLATDATLNFSLTVGSPVVLNPNMVLDFPNTATGSSSSAIPILVNNTTSTSATVSKVSIYGSGAKTFTSTNTCGGTIGPGVQCTIYVTFTPLVKGLHVANLQLQFTGAVDPTPLNLSGTGVAQSAIGSQ